MEGKIQTIKGLIEPGQLGRTLMHEHVLCDLTPPSLTRQGGGEVEITLENVWEIQYHWFNHLGNCRLNQEHIAIEELRRMGNAGGRSLVEMTCGGAQPNPFGLLRVAREAGINIIMGCGYYTEEFVPQEIRQKSLEALASEMISNVVKGVGKTDIRSGIIGEIGCSYPWTEFEKRVMQAAIIAQQETGAAVSVHPGRDPRAPLEIIGFIAKAGGDVSRTIIGHMDRTVFDTNTLRNLAQTGCGIEYDFFGVESSYYPFQDSIDLPNDGMRLNFIRFLVDEGYISQILISHDICTKTRLVYYGGHGYAHIFVNIVPMMRRKGFTEEEIDTILVENPRRLLTFV